MTMTREQVLRLGASAVNVRGRRSLDPTRTAVLRARFVVEARRRWTNIQRDIAESIVENDCFGIQPDVLGSFGGTRAANAPTRRTAFAFQSDAQKVKSFMEWLREQEDAGVLEVVQRGGGRASVGAAWSDTYIDTAYQQGIRRGRAEMRKSGISTPMFTELPGGLSATMNAPIHAATVQLLFTRTFEDLKTVAEVTNGRIRRQLIEGLQTGLSRGLAEGKNPRTVARELMKSLNREVDVIGKVRAEMIARTEIIRAHHLATINEYEQAAGEIQVEVQAELLTAGDDRVCPICEELEAHNPYTLDQARTLIPAHPQCRCAALPFIPSIMEPLGARNKAERVLVPQIKWLRRYLEAA